VDGQDVEGLLPVADSAGQVLAVAPLRRRDEVEDLHRGLLVGEMTAVADSPTESSVQRLNRVCRVDDPAELDGELEEWHELLPRILPGADHRWVERPPGLSELAEACFCGLDGRRCVDLSEALGDLPPVLLRGVAQTVAHEVHDTRLDGRVGLRHTDRFREALQPIAAHDQRVHEAAVA